MRKRYAYNKDMITDLPSCKHEAEEKVSITSTYVTYDGVEEHTTKGRACRECGLLLDCSPEEDRTATLLENKLIDLLGK